MSPRRCRSAGSTWAFCARLRPSAVTSGARQMIATLSFIKFWAPIQPGRIAARIRVDLSRSVGIPSERPTPNIAPSWNVAPTDPLPVVHYDAKAGERGLDVMRWGLIPYWAKDIKIGFSTINARAEEIDTKPAFCEAFQRRRCLVPLDNFYEWVRREVVCMIVRRRHPAGPAVPSAVPYEVGRVGNNPSKSPRTMYPAVTTGTETARRRYFCQHQGG